MSVCLSKIARDCAKLSLVGGSRRIGGPTRPAYESVSLSEDRYTRFGLSGRFFSQSVNLVVKKQQNNRLHKKTKANNTKARNCKHRRASAKPAACANSLSGPHLAYNSWLSEPGWSTLTGLISSGLVYCVAHVEPKTAEISQF